jgi:hypothetical protein
MTERHRSSKDLRKLHARYRVVFLTVLAGVLMLATAALVSACGSDSAQAPSQKVETMLKDRIQAMNTGNAAGLAKCYATNAILDNYADGGKNVQLNTAIADYFSGISKDYGMQWTAEGDPIQYDRYVVQRIKNTQLNGGTGKGFSVHVLELDSNDQIAHEWIIGWAQ